MPGSRRLRREPVASSHRTPTLASAGLGAAAPFRNPSETR